MGYKIEELRVFSFFNNKVITSVLDYLTEVINRENMINFIKSLIDSKTPFSLYLLDIDNFKSINDEYGHQMGDMVLKQFTSLLIEATKGKGLVGRYGGDEFLIVSLDTNNYDSTWQFSKSIFTVVRDTKFPFLNDESVSFTMGSVAYPTNALTYDELVLKADKALYRGKLKGRNCFIIYDEEKHKNIDISSKPDQLSDMVNHIYHLILENLPIEKKIVNIGAYLGNILPMSFYFVNSDGKVSSLSKNNSEILADIDINSLNPIFNDKDSIAVNDYSTIKEKYYAFHEYCWMNKIKSIICQKIFAKKETYGYLFVVDHKVKRLWQKDDKLLFSFVCKLLGLIYYRKI